jgi:hypothetical protein
MSFLAPLFLVGSLALGLPILFHLIRRTTRERNLFSSLMFLLPSPPRLTRRNRIEHLALLLLRCLAICCLAFGFARPFLKQAMAPPAGSAGKRILLLVDDSASMRRARLWADARARVDEILREATPADQVALYTFDRQLNPLFGFDQWMSAPLDQRAPLLGRKLADASPGWSSTQLGNALIQAAELLAESGGKTPAAPGRIELITDFQEGSHLEQLQGYEWPKGVDVAIDPLKSRVSNNASLELVSDSEDSDARSAAALRVRVSNTPGSKREQFKIGWANPVGNGFAGAPRDIYVPAGQSRILVLPPGASGSSDRVLLQGDDEEFDNVVFAIPPQTLHLNVTYVGADSEADSRQPLYFLKRAFQQTRHQSVVVTGHHSGYLLPSAEVQATRLFVLTAPLSPQSIGLMRDQAMEGKTVLVAADSIGMKQTLSGLLQTDNLKAEEVKPSTYAMLGEMDFRHPIFAPFADPRFSDFTKIHFWRYVQLDPTGIERARVVARFDSGDPALIEVPTGKGKILVLTSGWQPDCSQLALSSKFVPLMYSILESAGIPDSLPQQYRIGDVVPLASLGMAPQSQPNFRMPDASAIALGAGETNFTRTDIPGIYTVSTKDNTKQFVVNLDPAESRTVALPTDELERLGVPVLQKPTNVPVRDLERKTRYQNAELENRQKLWRWFIIGTLVVLLVETWLGGWTARRAFSTANAQSV